MRTVLQIVVCTFVLFLLVIVLSVLLPLADSDYPFDIFKLFWVFFCVWILHAILIFICIGCFPRRNCYFSNICEIYFLKGKSLIKIASMFDEAYFFFYQILTSFNKLKIGNKLVVGIFSWIWRNQRWPQSHDIEPYEKKVDIRSRRNDCNIQWCCR
jgi:hypothetical protein